MSAPTKVLIPLRVSVPKPFLVRPAAPLRMPETTVFEAPATVRRLPPLAISPAKVIAPAAAVKVCAAPSVIALLKICALAELLTMPLETVKEFPELVKLPAPLPKVIVVTASDETSLVAAPPPAAEKMRAEPLVGAEAAKPVDQLPEPPVQS